MKIAVASAGETLESKVEPRFGRASRFILIDSDNEGFEVIDNTKNLNSLQGAGIQSAQAVSRLGVDVVITGHCGPKAFRALQAAGIKVVLAGDCSVGEAVERFKRGEIEPAKSADVEGHW